MATQAATLSATISAIQDLFYQSGYAQKEVQILLNANKANLSDPGQLAQLIQAYQFFEALKECKSYTDPITGKKMDFSVYGAGGIFGSKGPELEKLVDSTLASVDKITMPSPLGGNVTVNIDGHPATLLDIVSNPNGQFTFTFDNSHIDYTGTNWCSKDDSVGFFGGLPNLFGGSASDTFKTQDGSIQVSESQSSLYHGSVSTFTCTANLGAIEDCASMSSSNPNALAANAAALDAFLSDEM